MSVPAPQIRYSVGEYLAVERAAEERHEFLDGQVYAMAGESPEHGAICSNISGLLYSQLRGGHCQVFSKDMKVRSGPAPAPGQRARGLFSYPDLLVVCGELRLYDEQRDVLLNPTLIIEVLSPTTEAFDRGEKWARYQTWLPDLVDYLLVSQSSPRIEQFHRQTGGWRYSSVDQLEDSLRIDAVNCALKLGEVYDRVAFPTQAAEDLSAE